MNNRILCLRGSARMDTCDSFKQSATADSASSRRLLVLYLSRMPQATGEEHIPHLSSVELLVNSRWTTRLQLTPSCAQYQENGYFY